MYTPYIYIYTSFIYIYILSITIQYCMLGHAWKFPTSIAPHDLDLLSEALGIAPADSGRANGMVPDGTLWAMASIAMSNNQMVMTYMITYMYYWRGLYTSFIEFHR